MIKYDYKTDLRALRALERKAKQAGKPLQKVLTKVAASIRGETKRLIKATPKGGGANVAKYVAYKSQPTQVRVLIYTNYLATFGNKGTKERKTKKGRNRGLIAYRYYWLYRAYQAKGQKLKEEIEKAHILL